MAHGALGEHKSQGGEASSLIPGWAQLLAAFGTAAEADARAALQSSHELPAVPPPEAPGAQAAESAVKGIQLWAQTLRAEQQAWDAAAFTQGALRTCTTAGLLGLAVKTAMTCNQPAVPLSNELLPISNSLLMSGADGGRLLIWCRAGRRGGGSGPQRGPVDGALRSSGRPAALGSRLRERRSGPPQSVRASGPAGCKQQCIASGAMPAASCDYPPHTLPSLYIPVNTVLHLQLCTGRVVAMQFTVNELPNDIQRSMEAGCISSSLCAMVHVPMRAPSLACFFSNAVHILKCRPFRAG